MATEQRIPRNERGSETYQVMEEFVREETTTVREVAEDIAAAYFSEEFFDAIGGQEAALRDALPLIAWREWWNGVTPVMRQLHYVYEQGDPYGEDRDLIIGLSKQIRDEIKHSQEQSKITRQFGGEVNLVDWEENSWMDEGTARSLIKQNKSAVVPDREGPHYAAFGLQCSTEILAVESLKQLSDYVGDTYPSVASTLASHISDEGDHIYLGKELTRRFGDPEEREELRAISERKQEAAEESFRASYERVVRQ